MRCKVCRECKQTKPVDEFHAKTRNEDRTIRTWQSFCKDCNRASRRAAATAKRRAAGVPLISDRRITPAEKNSRRRETYRIKKIDAGKKPRVIPSADGYRPADRDFVPAAPFLAWIENHKTVNGLSRQEMAEEIGIDESRLRTIESQRNISIAFVDKALMKSGTATQLWEIYPDPSD